MACFQSSRNSNRNCRGSKHHLFPREEIIERCRVDHKQKAALLLSLLCTQLRDWQTWVAPTEKYQEIPQCIQVGRRQGWGEQGDAAKASKRKSRKEKPKSKTEEAPKGMEKAWSSKAKAVNKKGPSEVDVYSAKSNKAKKEDEPQTTMLLKAKHPRRKGVPWEENSQCKKKKTRDKNQGNFWRRGRHA